MHPCAVFRPIVRVRPGQPASHAHVRPDQLERLRFKSTARHGSCADALLSRGVPLPARAFAARPGRPGSFPRRSPGGALGVLRSLRRFHPAYGWRDISAAPGPPVVRASRAAPIHFRRGDRLPVGRNRICKGESAGAIRRSTSGLRSRLRSVSWRTFGRGTILPWALPLAGLSGTLLCNRAVSTPPRITDPRCRPTALPQRARATPIRSWV